MMVKHSLWAVLFLLLSSYDLLSQQFQFDKFGDGIRITAKDSSFYTKFSFRFQTLYQGRQEIGTTNWNENFLIRRSRLKFDGYVLNPKIAYKVELGISNRDTRSGSIEQNGSTANIILDAVIKWNFVGNWYLWAGQTKLPGNRERVISSQALQFVDRSLVNSRFTLDRDVGIQLRHKFRINNFEFRQAFAISTGDGRNVIASNPKSGRQFTGRLEFLPFGKFKNKGDYFGSDLMREENPKLSIGITGDYNNNAVRSRGNLGQYLYDSLGNYRSSDLTTLMIDGILKYRGLSVSSEYVHRTSPKIIDGFGYGSGLMGSAGYLFPSNLEIALRHTRIDPHFNESSLSQMREYTLGLSKYINQHNFKVQSDFSYLSISTKDFLVFRVQCELSI